MTGKKPAHGLASGQRTARRRSGGAAGRLFLWRLSALRRHGQPVRGDEARSRRMPKKAARCWASATAFRSLTEAGLLPGALMRNAGLKFVCRPVALSVEETQSAFTRKYDKGQSVTFPVAHGEGNYYADDETLNRLEGEGRVMFRYPGQSQRLGPRHRRHPQRKAQCAGPDAPSRTGGGPASPAAPTAAPCSRV